MGGRDARAREAPPGTLRRSSSLSAALPRSLGAPLASRRAVVTAAGCPMDAQFAWVGADAKHAGEFLQLDHYYCCDAVDFESLSASAARLVKATGKALPAELQARALWRFVRCEATDTLRSLDENALDGLEALDDLAEEHGVVPRAGAPLLLEVRAPGCRPPAAARRARPRLLTRPTRARSARSARWRTCGAASPTWSASQRPSTLCSAKSSRRRWPSRQPPRCASGARPTLRLAARPGSTARRVRRCVRCAQNTRRQGLKARLLSSPAALRSCRRSWRAWRGARA